MTRYERLRQMEPEEIAQAISDRLCILDACPILRDCEAMGKEECMLRLLGWLKEEEDRT